MNTGIFGEGFPYSNFHDINMDWLIKIAKDFLDQYTHIQEIIESGETSLTELTENGIEQLTDKADELEGLLQTWYNEHSSDIADQLRNALADLNEWYTTHEHYLDTIVETNIAYFYEQAETKTQQCLDSIPDDYSELASAVQAIEDSIVQPSVNLWTYGDKSFTKKVLVSSGTDPATQLLPAGTYTISAVVTSEAPGDSCRIGFYDVDSQQITYGLVKRGGRYSTTVTLDRACYFIYLYSGVYDSQSTGITGSWEDIQIQKGTLATPYTPPTTGRDANLELVFNEYTKDHQIAPNKVHMDSIQFAVQSSNLFNYEDERNVMGAYIDSNGNTAENANYNASWFIPVKQNTQYYVCGAYINTSYQNIRFLAEYDIAFQFIAFHDTITESFTTSNSTFYIRLTYGTNISKDHIYIGEEENDGNKVPYYYRYISNINPKENIAFASGNLSGTSFLGLMPLANSIRSEERLVFNADITSFNGIEIGYAWYSLSYKYNRIEIGTDEITVYDYYGNSTDYPLTISIANNIQVIIEQEFNRNYTLTIISNGKWQKITTLPLDRKRVCFPYAQTIGSILTNAKLSWTCTQFNKDIWIFGDSYIDGWTNKWSTYAYTSGYAKNCLWDAFGGQTSEQAYESLVNLLKIYTPKILVWTLGQNDGTDQNEEPSSMWSTYQEKLRTLCKEQKIELVLATVPTIPSINNEYKNANIRSSGYRYIDIARAVGATSNGTWYGDMLSDDELHPSDDGAKAIYARVLLDLPEIMIDN